MCNPQLCRSLSLLDRLTMLPFIAAFIDFDSSEETFEKYDKMSAYELFQKCGVSKAAYEEFLRPTLLVVRALLPVYMTPVYVT